MNQRSFPIAPKLILAVTSTYLYGDGQELAAKILDRSHAEIVQTGYDNWNGGTYSYCLHIHISREDFIRFGFENIQTLQNTIREKLNVFSKPHPNYLIDSVSITPTITIEIRQSQNDYLQHSAVSEAILNFIALTEKRISGAYVEDTIIAQELSLEIQDVRDWIDVLEIEGKVTTANSFEGYSALLTAKGRLFLKSAQPNLQVNTEDQEIQGIDVMKVITTLLQTIENQSAKGKSIHLSSGNYYESVNSTSSVNTDGGTFVSGEVNAGGDFIGRDKS